MSEQHFKNAMSHNPSWKRLFELVVGKLTEADGDLLREAYDEAFNAGYHQGASEHRSDPRTYGSPRYGLDQGYPWDD